MSTASAPFEEVKFEILPPDGKKQDLAFDILSDRIARLADSPPEPAPVLSFDGIRLGTPGGIVTIEGQIKSGKTGLLSAVLASPFALEGREDFCFDIEADIGDGSVLHFDTEQSLHDHHRLLRVAMRRAGLPDIPDRLHSASLLPVPIGLRMAALRQAIADLVAADQPPRLVLLDGIADFLPGGPNDEAGSVALVAELMGLANERGFCAVCILHENPGSDYGKTRGHLGSELWRKSESCIGTTKAKDGISTVCGKYLRGGDWPEDRAIHFRWSDSEKMHVLCESPDASRAAAKAAAKRAELEKLADEVLPKTALGVSYSALWRKIANCTGLSERSAKGKIAALRSERIIQQDENEHFTRTI